LEDIDKEKQSDDEKIIEYIDEIEKLDDKNTEKQY